MSSRRLTWRVPNVALVYKVELAEERRLAPSKRPIRIDVPPGVTLGDLMWLSGHHWRIEMVSDSVAYAHEVDANYLPLRAGGC